MRTLLKIVILCLFFAVGAEFCISVPKFSKILQPSLRHLNYPTGFEQKKSVTIVKITVIDYDKFILHKKI